MIWEGNNRNERDAWVWGIGCVKGERSKGWSCSEGTVMRTPKMVMGSTHIRSGQGNSAPRSPAAMVGTPRRLAGSGSGFLASEQGEPLRHSPPAFCPRRVRQAGRGLASVSCGRQRAVEGKGNEASVAIKSSRAWKGGARGAGESSSSGGAFRR